MAHSNLVDMIVPADGGNYTVGRNTSIRDITIHHMAGVLSAAQCGGIFARAGRGGSAHYGIGNGGEVGCYVEEENTAWTNSNWPSNCRSVTIEVSNSATGGDWPVSDAAFDKLVKLVADIAKRNGLGRLKAGDNLTWHSMFSATTCPGDYLRSRMDKIAELANDINYGTPEPAPAKKSNDEMADEVIKGLWGNNPERKQRLEAAGYDYGAIQAIVNAKLAPTPAPAQDGFKVGDVVVPTSLVDYNGTRLVQYDDTYTISELNGDRAVLVARGAVWAAMNIKNIKKA